MEKGWKDEKEINQSSKRRRKEESKRKRRGKRLQKEIN